MKFKKVTVNSDKGHIPLNSLPIGESHFNFPFLPHKPSVSTTDMVLMVYFRSE